MTDAARAREDTRIFVQRNVLDQALGVYALEMLHGETGQAGSLRRSELLSVVLKC